MKTYEFPYGGAEWDAVIDVDLTDEEAARLEASAHAEPRWHLDEDDDINDIYQKVEQIIYDENKRIIIEDGRLEELKEFYEDEEEIPSDDELIEEEMGIWHVCYPEALQYLGEKEEN